MLGPAAIVVADGVEDAPANNGGKKFLEIESKKNGTDGRKHKIVN